MLQFFRNFFKSSIGVAVTLGMVGIIALAFAAGDVANNAGFGGAGGDKVARVDKNVITTAQLSKQVQQQAEQLRAENPTMSTKAFVAQGGLEDVLGQLIDRVAMTQFGANHGVIAGKRLIDSELAKLPQFQNPDGSFNNTAYRQLLAQRQLTDADVREDIAQGLVARQLLAPAQQTAVVPADLALRYAGVLKEARTGVVAMLPSAAFAPKGPPSDADLAAYYAAHAAAWNRPETRVIRYALFDDSVIRQTPAPTPAEIASYYAAHKADYAASETRKLTQLIVPGEADAKAILAAVAGGQSLDAAAAAHGFTTAAIGPVTKDALATQASSDVANAAFAAPKGKLVGPIKALLGYTLVKVDAIDGKPARDLAAATGDITKVLADQKRRAAIAAMTQKIDDGFSKGGALSDAAKDLGVPIASTGSVLASGQSTGKGPAAPAQIAKLLPAAFAMEHEGQAQIAELVPGKSFVIYDVAHITPAAPAPLAEIKGEVIAEYAMDKGQPAAEKAARKLMADVRQGKDLATAIAGLGVSLPAPQPITMSRQQLAAAQGRVPAAVTLLFSMAQGTIKLLPAPQNRGWFVVQLKQINDGQTAANDPQLAGIQNEIAQVTTREYGDALRRAIRAEATVTRNEPAIKAVAAQLAGTN